MDKYIYKVISVGDWRASQQNSIVKLSTIDEDFIHLAKEDQLERIISKYWNDRPDFVVLKIDAQQLPGELRFETNPGGNQKYYHLYGGAIPLRAVVEVIEK